MNHPVSLHFATLSSDPADNPSAIAKRKLACTCRCARTLKTILNEGRKERECAGRHAESRKSSQMDLDWCSGACRPRNFSGPACQEAKGIKGERSSRDTPGCGNHSRTV